jgi:hypothetical protein
MTAHLRGLLSSIVLGFVYQTSPPERILGGRLSASQATPGPATPLILMQTDREYLLFLRPFGNRRGQYQLYMAGAFEAGARSIRLILKGYSDVFKDIADTQISELVRRVEDAAAK